MNNISIIPIKLGMSDLSEWRAHDRRTLSIHSIGHDVFTGISGGYLRKAEEFPDIRFQNVSCGLLQWSAMTVELPLGGTCDVCSPGDGPVSNWLSATECIHIRKLENAKTTATTESTSLGVLDRDLSLLG